MRLEIDIFPPLLSAIPVVCVFLHLCTSIYICNMFRTLFNPPPCVCVCAPLIYCLTYAWSVHKRTPVPSPLTQLTHERYSTHTAHKTDTLFSYSEYMILEYISGNTIEKVTTEHFNKMEFINIIITYIYILILQCNKIFIIAQ